MGWEATVMLRVEVKEDGTVGDLSVRRSSGHAILDEAALTAVRGWRFTPPRDGGFSMSTVVDVPVRFDLKEYREPSEGRPGP
jgi:protein TonB